MARRFFPAASTCCSRSRRGTSAAIAGTRHGSSCSRWQRASERRRRRRQRCAAICPTGHLVYALGGSLFAVEFDVGPAGGRRAGRSRRRRRPARAGRRRQAPRNSASPAPARWFIFLARPSASAAASSRSSLADRKGVGRKAEAPARCIRRPSRVSRRQAHRLSSTMDARTTSRSTICRARARCGG